MEQFTDELVKRLANRREGLIFMLWGSYAQKKAAQVGSRETPSFESPAPVTAIGASGFLRLQTLLCGESAARTAGLGTHRLAAKAKAIDQGDSTMSTEDVIFFEHPSSDGSVVAEARLNIPPTLNALTLDAVEAMTPKMKDWAERDEVAVIVTGEGDKAFCAGGDVQALYHAATENLAAGHTVNDYPERFFAAEYRLDYTGPLRKPLLTLGHGIVMGGGYGLFRPQTFAW